MPVIDASVLIVSGKSGRLALLKELFGSVTVSKEVRDEALRKPGSAEAVALENAIKENWVAVKDTSPPDGTPGKGESSSISLAIQEKDILIIDDRKVAFVASTMGMECRGTPYLLFLGLKRGIIRDRKETIELLAVFVANGLYLSSDVIAEFYALLERM